MQVTVSRNNLAENKKTYLGIVFLSLFTSVSTLLCCALPALLVTLGMGAVVVGMTSAVPGLIILSEYKTSLFITSFVLLTIAGLMLYRSRNMPCPMDPIKRQACLMGRKISFWTYLFSLVIWFIGFFFAYLYTWLSKL